MAKSSSAVQRQSSSSLVQEELFHGLIRGWLNEGHASLEFVVVGEAGQGKSSLINGLLGKEVAKEGNSLDPGTQMVEKYLYEENGVAVRCGTRLRLPLHPCRLQNLACPTTQQQPHFPRTNIFRPSGFLDLNYCPLWPPLSQEVR